MNQPLHNRQSIRLKGYDYSQAGLYFITVCTHNRECLFGNIVDRVMILNDSGKMIETEWLKLSKRFLNIRIHEYVVMPNHFHGIIEIVQTNVMATVGATLVVAHQPNPQNNVGATLVVALNENVSEYDDAKIDNGKNVDGQNGNTINDGVHKNNDIRATTRVAPTSTINKTIGDMMDAFKSITTVEYIRGVKNLGWSRFNGKLWQRNYHDHIIRNYQSYVTISEYIINNPAKWKDDKFYEK